MHQAHVGRCRRERLSRIAQLQIIGDYLVAVGGSSYLAALYVRGMLREWTLSSIITGFILSCPTEYIFPRIGWVYYRKCATYEALPVQTTWILHSLWDTFMLFGIVVIVSCFYGEDILWRYNGGAAVCMNVLGMAQEIVLEVNQTLWYYPPNRINRVWARIGGRDMTLQQWRWSILPQLYYLIIVQLNPAAGSAHALIG